MTESDPADSSHIASSVREPRPPLVTRKIWILGFTKSRIEVAAKVFADAGHRVRHCEPGGELGNTIRDFRPDIIVIDMADQPDRGRHAAVQLRADRATRQLPVVLVAVVGEEREKSDKTITGPTRRYALPLDAPSVLNSVLADL